MTQPYETLAELLHQRQLPNEVRQETEACVVFEDATIHIFRYKDLINRQFHILKYIKSSQANVDLSIYRNRPEEIIHCFGCWFSSGYIILDLENYELTLGDIMGIQMQDPLHFHGDILVKLIYFITRNIVELQKFQTDYPNFIPSNILLTRTPEESSHQNVLFAELPQPALDPMAALFQDGRYNFQALYYPPERLLGIQQSMHQSASWSIGVIAFQLFHRRLPFQSTQEISTAEPSFHPGLDPGVIDFIAMCLKKEHRTRQSPLKLLSHPIFKRNVPKINVEPGMVVTRGSDWTEEASDCKILTNGIVLNVTNDTIEVVFNEKDPSHYQINPKAPCLERSSYSYLDIGILPLTPGMRVKRGPNWRPSVRGNEDGGESGTGRIIDISSFQDSGSVYVEWDLTKKRASYEYHNGKLEVAPAFAPAFVGAKVVPGPHFSMFLRSRNLSSQFPAKSQEGLHGIINTVNRSKDKWFSDDGEPLSAMWHSYGCSNIFDVEITEYSMITTKVFESTFFRSTRLGSLPLEIDSIATHLQRVNPFVVGCLVTRGQFWRHGLQDNGFLSVGVIRESHGINLIVGYENNGSRFEIDVSPDEIQPCSAGSEAFPRLVVNDRVISNPGQYSNPNSRSAADLVALEGFVNSIIQGSGQVSIQWGNLSTETLEYNSNRHEVLPIIEATSDLPDINTGMFVLAGEGREERIGRVQAKHGCYVDVNWILSGGVAVDVKEKVLLNSYNRWIVPCTNPVPGHPVLSLGAEVMKVGNATLSAPRGHVTRIVNLSSDYQEVFVEWMDGGRGYYSYGHQQSFQVAPIVIRM